MFGLKTRAKKIVGFYQRTKSRRYRPLPQSFWDLQVDEKGSLCPGSCSLKELAETYGTPLYVVNEERARSNCKRLFTAFGSAIPGIEIFFSYKTNPVPGMLRVFHEEGVGAEVISDYELWLAFRLGVPPEKIVFNGLNKSTESLSLAVEKGIRLINIDSFREIDKLARISDEKGKGVDVGIRVLTGSGWGGQFGFPIDSGEAFEAVDRIKRSQKLNLKGLHFHLGTLIQSPKKYRDALDAVFAFLLQTRKKLGMEVQYLDTGGGYGVPTVKAISGRERELSGRYGVPVAPPQDAGYPSPEDYAAVIAERIEARCKDCSIKFPTVFIEPGRLMSSSAQYLLLKVCDVKERKGMPKIAIMDGGSVNMAYPTMGEYREVFVADQGKRRKKGFYKIVGPLCSPGDVLYHSKYLPKLEIGDYLAIMDAGAYFVPNANNFSFPRPAICMVSKEGHRLLRARETFDFMIANDRMETEASLFQ